MKRLTVLVAALLGGATLMHGQIRSGTSKTHFVSTEGMSRNEVVLAMATGQFRDVMVPLDEVEVTDTRKKNHDDVYYYKPTSNVNMGQKPFYPDYQPYKEDGKLYDEITVINLNDRERSEVVVGTITDQLPKEKLYKEIERETELANVAAVEPTAVDNSFNPLMVKVEEYKVETSTGKVFVITDAGQYRYFDGKKLGGSVEMVNELKKGKPITEMTFFYEAQADGLIDEFMTISEFTKLDIVDQVKLIANQ